MIDSDRQTHIGLVLENCRDRLKQHYHERFKSLILYGSAARQEMTESSDIDLLVILEPPLDYFQEIATIVELLYPFQLEASHWISAKPVAVDEFEAGIIQLYRHAKQEGVIV